MASRLPRLVRLRRAPAQRLNSQKSSEPTCRRQNQEVMRLSETRMRLVKSDQHTTNLEVEDAWKILQLMVIRRRRVIPSSQGRQHGFPKVKAAS
mmetsp:Transcript_18408/g.69655  ORF Transcript_18408/g.69655 Transcript_18408/m.69655 type:complete len:94 (+) Transcript_18408:624-905(+)